MNTLAVNGCEGKKRNRAKAKFQHGYVFVHKRLLSYFRRRRRVMDFRQGGTVDSRVVRHLNVVVDEECFHVRPQGSGT
jgi:hypothetical protein